MKKTLTFASAAIALAVSVVAGGPALAGGMESYGPAVPVPAPKPIPDYFGQYYLRLDAAYAWGDSDRFDTGSVLYNQNRRRDEGLSEGGRLGFGAGMYISRWLRADVTFDSRDQATGYVRDALTYDDGTNPNPDLNISDTLTDSIKYRNGTGLANLYIDLPVTSHFTPYIGAGVGMVVHSISRDLNQTVSCTADALVPASCGGNPAGYSLDNRVVEKDYQFALATALMAGFTYQVTDAIKTDVGYRWLHLDGATFTQWVGTQLAYQRLVVPDQNIHEMRVGLRWDIN